MNNAITIKNLCKKYATGKEALKDVSLTVSEGEFTALLGVNGAGKTTLIGILTGLIKKNRGLVQLFDKSIDTDPTEAKKLVGVVPQEINFNLFAKVETVLLNQAGYFGVSRSIARNEADKLLHLLHLWDYRHHEIRTLSGGMKRRLMLARALVHRPRLLLLDEPTTGIDVHLRDLTWHFLRELNHQGTTILLTTHYLEEVEQLCKRVAFIKEGQVVCTDTVEKIAARLDQQTYILTLDSTEQLSEGGPFHLHILNATQLEVEFSSPHTITNLVEVLKGHNRIVYSIRPKRNRLEQLFLKLNESGVQP